MQMVNFVLNSLVGGENSSKFSLYSIIMAELFTIFI
ncbi:hypothetical protein ACVQ92_10650 [Staphylococcus aureus]